LSLSDHHERLARVRVDSTLTGEAAKVLRDGSPTRDANTSLQDGAPSGSPAYLRSAL